jgi:hypothetical protein
LQVLRIDGTPNMLDDCSCSVIGILEQMAALETVCPGLRQHMRALNVHLVACVAVNDETFCLDTCSPSEYALLKLIAILLKNDGVVIGGVIGYGALAAGVFGDRPSCTQSSAARRSKTRRSSARL